MLTIIEIRVTEITEIIIIIIRNTEEGGGRGLESFKEVYDETKTRVACYMATSADEWIKVARKNEMNKEQTLLKREAEATMGKMDVLATFGERYVNWKEAWKKLKNRLSEGQRRNRKRNFAEKALQSEIPSKYDEADYEWLKCNTNPRKQRPYSHCRSRWSNQEHGSRSEDLLKTTNAGYVESIEKQSSTSCQNVKTGRIGICQTPQQYTQSFGS